MRERERLTIFHFLDLHFGDLFFVHLDSRLNLGLVFARVVGLVWIDPVAAFKDVVGFVGVQHVQRAFVRSAFAKGVGCWLLKVSHF